MPDAFLPDREPPGSPLPHQLSKDPAAMSIYTGRMSRADAQRTLSEIRPAVREFLSPDASAATRAEAQDVSDRAYALQFLLDSGDRCPDAEAIRALCTRVAGLQADRLANSLTAPPRISQAVCVTMYGIFGNTIEAATAIASRQLACDVRLQDRSDVRTATTISTRYIFTSRTP